MSAKLKILLGVSGGLGAMFATVVTNSKRYDWQTWLIGIQRSFVQGGAGAVVNALGAIGLDPNTFNLASGLRKTIALAGISFAVQGIIHMAVFLQTHPAPDPVDIVSQPESGQLVRVPIEGIQAQAKTVVTPNEMDGKR